MNRKRVVVALGLVALLALGAVAGGIFYTGPQRALVEVRNAFVSKDAQRLGQLIDFPAVRTSVKAQILAELSEQMEADPADQASKDLGLKLIDQMLDAMFTPEGIIALTDTPEAIQDLKGMTKPSWAEDFKRTASTYFVTSSRAEVTIVDGQTPDSLVVFLEREGLNWRVVGGRVDKGAADPTLASQ